MAMSEGHDTLKIRRLCKVCDDRETMTDLMVIQCNASNVHGYVYAQGYVNVLGKNNIDYDNNNNHLV